VHFKIDVRLDPTLGCGQAHRWRKQPDDSWQGVIGKDVITLYQTPDGFDCEGCTDMAAVRSYFRAEDNLPAIIREISVADPQIAALSAACPGLRLLRQPEWECLATYVLATNVNVKRIAKMVESVCDHFGTDLGARRAFPTPRQILDGGSCIGECRLGFREGRFMELAQRIDSGDFNIRSPERLPYEELTARLQDLKGVGPKVADCVALFGYGRLEAFPVDVRIADEMKKRYGVTGNYQKIAAVGRERFGRYAGYAQEFLYHSGSIGAQ